MLLYAPFLLLIVAEGNVLVTARVASPLSFSLKFRVLRTDSWLACFPGLSTKFSLRTDCDRSALSLQKLTLNFCLTSVERTRLLEGSIKTFDGVSCLPLWTRVSSKEPNNVVRFSFKLKLT